MVQFLFSNYFLSFFSLCFHFATLIMEHCQLHCFEWRVQTQPFFRLDFYVCLSWKQMFISSNSINPFWKQISITNIKVTLKLKCLVTWFNFCSLLNVHQIMNNPVTCGGGDPVAAHLNDMNWSGRTIWSLNVAIISGIISANKQ